MAPVVFAVLAAAFFMAAIGVLFAPAAARGPAALDPAELLPAPAELLLPRVAGASPPPLEALASAAFAASFAAFVPVVCAVSDFADFAAAAAFFATCAFAAASSAACAAACAAAACAAAAALQVLARGDLLGGDPS